ncbi:MAG: hypothetical protein DRN57_06970 [Thermoplasmata archaeon]|nr:MAG: hypothetical protein DRN57_06970 [Thermoplasmata archaeon]
MKEEASHGNVHADMRIPGDMGDSIVSEKGAEKSPVDWSIHSSKDKRESKLTAMKMERRL